MAQRQALQVQVQGVLGSRNFTLDHLLLTQDRLADLHRQLARNSAELTALDRQQLSLASSIASTRARIQAKKDLLAGLVRQQYKTREDTSMSQILFGSSDLGQVVDRIQANDAIGARAHSTLVDLKQQDTALASDSSALTHRRADAAHLQTVLTAQKSDLQAQVADYQAQLNTLDTSSQSLLARINQLDAAIAAANAPPSGGFTFSQQQVILIIRTAAARYSANGDQLVRVATCESGLNPRAYDPYSGASGLFQFMPGTFYGHGGHDLWDPTDQSNVAARMFAEGDSGAWGCK